MVPGPTDPTSPPQHREDLVRALDLLRRRHGLSIRDLARRADVPHSTVAGYLNARHLPTRGGLGGFRRMLTELGVPDEQLDGWLASATRIRLQPTRPADGGPPPWLGLRSYGRDDAALFFGRTTATRALVELARGGGLVALVGVSGAGKSSLLGAGLQAAWAPTGRCLQLTPATGPDPSELDPTGEDLVIVDQFEEVLGTGFTDSARGAWLDGLGRVTERAAAVVIGLRADFYGRAAAEPVLLEALTHRQLVLGAMTRDDVRDAVQGPAAQAGLTVEPALVDTLLSDLVPPPRRTMEPGSLPLLSHVLRLLGEGATDGRLTLDAYREVGGLAGAVRSTAEAVHAELDPAEQLLAKRVFLRTVDVDDQGTVTRRRATFTDPVALDLIGRFVDARLMTADDDAVQLSHESLVWSWPRLAEWIDEDRAAIVARRQLHQQTEIWLQTGRSDEALLRGNRLGQVVDFLQTSGHGTELDAGESEFVAASRRAQDLHTSTERRRNRRLRRLVVLTSVLALVAVGLAVFGLVRQSQAQNARNDAQAAEARALSRQVAGDATTLKSTDPNLAAQLAVQAYRISPTIQARSALLDMTALAVPTRIAGHDGPTFGVVDAAHELLATSDATTGGMTLFDVSDPDTPRRVGGVAGATGKQLFAAAFTPDGSALVAGGADMVLQVWTVAADGSTFPLATLPAFTKTAVNAIAVSPDGTEIAAAGSTDTIVRYRISPSGLARLPDARAPGASFRTVAFSADSTRLVAAGLAGVIDVWPVAPLTGTVGSPVSTTLPSGSRINAVAARPGAAEFAVTDNTGVVTRFGFGTPLTALAAPTEKFGSWGNALVYSTDGKRLAAGSADSTASVWDLTGQRPTRTFHQAFPALVTAVAFAPDGRLVTSITDGSTEIWPPTGSFVTGGGSYTLAWSGDSTKLLAGSAGTAPLVLPELGPDGSPTGSVTVGATATLPTGDSYSGIVGLSPDGTVAALGLAFGGVQLWDLWAAPAVQIGPTLSQPTPNPATASTTQQSLLFSASGRLLVGAGLDGRVWLWNVADPRNPTLVATIPGTSTAYWAAFNPDASMLATAESGDNSVHLYSLAEPTHPVLVATLTGFSSYVDGVAFSPDGRQVAGSGADRTVRIWDIADPAHPRQLGPPLSGPQNELFEVAYSPDGSKVVAAGTDGSAWIWDVTDPASPAVWAELDTGGRAFAAEFSPDGRLLASATAAGTVSVFRSDPQAAISAICGQVGAPLAEQKWSIYLPEQPYTQPCPG